MSGLPKLPGRPPPPPTPASWCHARSARAARSAQDASTLVTWRGLPFKVFVFVGRTGFLEHGARARDDKSSACDDPDCSWPLGSAVGNHLVKRFALRLSSAFPCPVPTQWSLFLSLSQPFDGRENPHVCATGRQSRVRRATSNNGEGLFCPTSGTPKLCHTPYRACRGAPTLSGWDAAGHNSQLSIIPHRADLSSLPCPAD